MLASLMASLTGCATERLIIVPVDPTLARDCGRPGLEGDTWRDLAEAYVERGAALDECTERMREVRGMSGSQ